MSDSIDTFEGDYTEAVARRERNTTGISESVATTGTDRPRLQDRSEPGSSILDLPDVIEAIWGVGRDVAWAKDETFIPFGPTGIGKTTVVQHVIAVGMRTPGLGTKVLGLEVVKFDKPWLYVAADRPRQIKRAFKRLFGEMDREFLEERLIIHHGAPGFSMSNPDHVEWACEDAVAMGVGGIVFDSLKDVTSGLVSDEHGQAISKSFNALNREGIQVALPHHARKVDGRPNSINDMYGSVLIPGSAGTVLVIWGDPGDDMVDIKQLKFADDGGLGPLKALIDKRTGLVTTAPESQVEWFMLNQLTFTAKGLAEFWFSSPDGGPFTPSVSQINKARSRIKKHLGDKPERLPSVTVERKGTGKEPTVYSVVFGQIELDMKTQLEGAS